MFAYVLEVILISLIDLEGFSKKRGQVSHIESSESLEKSNLPICAKGYIISTD